MIARSLGEMVLTEFGRCDSAAELRKALEARLGTMDALEIHKLKLKLIANQRSNFASMSEYIEEYTRIVALMESCSTLLSDSESKECLIAGLGSENWSFEQPLKALRAKSPTEAQQNTPSAMIAPARRFQGYPTFCNVCGKSDHNSRTVRKGGAVPAKSKVTCSRIAEQALP